MYELIAIGASWGGLEAVSTLLETLDPQVPAAVVVAQHRASYATEALADVLQERTRLVVRDAEDKDDLIPGHVYLAPPDYHLLVESDGTLALSTDDRVQYARPSIDVLFESAADAYRERCVGFELVSVTSGEDALRELLRQEFALILLDVQMPGLDGFETASLIKRRARTRNVPIIFVTAISKQREHVFRGYSAGAVDYVFKPFDPKVLRSKVAAFVDLHRKNAELRRQEEDLRARELEDVRRAE